VAKRSAGLLPYRKRGSSLEVFLVHPGGPFWRKKDAGAWSIPKGEYPEGEDPLDGARREFQEETGRTPDGDLIPLTEIRQSGGKYVKAWAMETDFDASTIVSNTFFLEWPPKSGKQQEFPEVDRAGWFSIETAREKILPAQAVFLDELISKLN
jgi:predicted NUDIX family NTP pyrophosphohydrolase